jgi:type IV pilus assembly protein PilM
MALAFLKGLFSGSKSPEVAAIDMGSNSVKICQIGGNIASPQLYTFISRPTPPMTVKDGTIIGSQALGDTIRAAILEEKLTCKRMVTSVFGQQVVIRPIVMTKMSEKELDQAIKFEAERYLPYSVQDAQISGKIINEDAGGKNDMEVLLIAVPNEIVSNSREVIKLADIEPSGIDLEPLALYRAMKHCVDPNIVESTVAILNLGASSCSINIFKGGALRHNRTISVAGNSFTKAIGQALNLSFEEAEKYKQEKAVVKVESDPTPLAPTSMRIFGVITPVLAELVTEVTRSFDYYRSRYKFEGVENVVLCGGTARLKNIDVFLSKELKVNCQIANPFKNLGTSKLQNQTAEDLAAVAPAAMVVTGLALREVS